jgi:hypothetical protein
MADMGSDDILGMASGFHHRRLRWSGHGCPIGFPYCEGP